MQSAVRALIEGLAHLRRAGQMLAAANRDGEISREAVLAAAQSYWSAVFYSDGWPCELQQLSEALTMRLLGRGPLQVSLSAMDQAELRQTCRQMCELVQLALATDETSASGGRIRH